MNDLRHVPAGQVPVSCDSGPRVASESSLHDVLKEIAADAKARRNERREAALRAQAERETKSDERRMPKPQAGRPALSQEQRKAERALFRHGCDWLALHHLCSKMRCRKAQRCRGDAVACLRAAIPLVPESARQFVREMIEGQEWGLSFEEAMEKAEELQDGWASWIAGLEAASKARGKAASGEA
jgi:hypothetical protein